MTDENPKTEPGPMSRALAAIVADRPTEEILSFFGGWNPDDHVDPDEARREAEYRWARLSTADFPRRAIDAARTADDSTAAIRRVCSWTPETESILVLSGAPGCGKTVAATWWASKQRRTPRFVRATTFAASSRYDRDTRDTWFNARGLVLDDLGTEYLDAKGSFLVDLDELLDVFYGDKKPLLITTNCTKDAFKERYGARVVDRLRESGSWFSISDASRRTKPQ